MREPLRLALLELDATLAAAAAEAVSLLERSVILLRDPDDEVAQEVISGAVAAQATREDIEGAVERVMALQSPVASDLRMILAAALVAYHVERVAANAGRIAKLTMEAPPPLHCLSRLQDMGVEAARAVRAAMAAFASGDPAHNVDLEASVLRLHEDERDVMESITGGQGPSSTTALLAARYLTRVGEHASAIGQRTATMALGRAELDLEA
jgi:phosphate transport system protein